MLGFSPYSPEDSYEIEHVYSQNRRGKVKLKGSEIDLRSNSDSLGEFYTIINSSVVAWFPSWNTIHSLLIYMQDAWYKEIQI